MRECQPEENPRCQQVAKRPPPPPMKDHAAHRQRVNPIPPSEGKPQIYYFIPDLKTSASGPATARRINCCAQSASIRATVPRMLALHFSLSLDLSTSPRCSLGCLP